MTVFEDNKPIEVPIISLTGNLVKRIKERGRGGPRYIKEEAIFDKRAPNRERLFGPPRSFTTNITYRKESLLIFKDYVKVTMALRNTKMMPYERQIKRYGVDNKMIFLGKLEDEYRNMGEIRYTLNGKDPSRTKYKVYVGYFRLRPGTISTDKIVLKARTYADGRWSDVTSVDIKIVDDAFLKGMTGSTIVYA